jgi:hypothetical protein
MLIYQQDLNVALSAYLGLDEFNNRKSTICEVRALKSSERRAFASCVPIVRLRLFEPNPLASAIRGNEEDSRALHRPTHRAERCVDRAPCMVLEIENRSVVNSGCACQVAL